MKSLLLLAAGLALAYGCGNSLTGSGTFTTPNHPSEYDNNADCSWSLTADAGKQVCITFDAFALESSSSCSYDSVTISALTGGQIGTYCGSTAPAPINTGASAVNVRFQSDSSLTYGGFSARFTSCDASAVPSAAPPTTTRAPGGGSCGGSFTGAEGTFSSPGYPNAYEHNLDCTYTINAGEGPILITISSMDIEQHSSCTYDYLEHNGNRACGTGSTTFRESTSVATLKFVSDSSVNGNGFTGSWKKLTCADYNGQCVAAGSCDGSTRNVPCDNGGECCVARGDCGKIPSDMASRIINGADSVAHSWPWQASLQTTSSSFHFCGATLVNEEWAVTAAHCVDGDSASAVKLVLGEHSISSPGVETTHMVQQIIMHESYETGPGAFPNDIALLKLAEPVVLSDYIQPACLADPDDTFAGNDNCWITGWGRTEAGTPDILQELNIEVKTQPDCVGMWGTNINDGHICLGDGTSGACNGDSGGPLVCRVTSSNGDFWKLAGATSWGRSGCQTAGYPSVYSRISYFRGWIDNKIASN